LRRRPADAIVVVHAQSRRVLDVERVHRAVLRVRGLNVMLDARHNASVDNVTVTVA